MPLYEYQCAKCGHQFEMIQKFSDPIKTKCPKCGGRLEKLPSAPAVHFKGTGWYVTDYGKGRSGASEKPAGKNSKSEPAGGESKDKPADKTSDKKDGGGSK